MTPILPPEILANVVYQVFNHCRHLNTLYTLLFTSKSLFNEATRVLYYDPFKSSQLALHNPALIDLVRFLFSVSPLEDEINEVRVLLDIPRIKNPMANYLDLILSDKMQLNDAYSYFSPAMLSEYWGVEGSKAEDLYRCQKIQASLAWTVYGGRLSRFKQIHFPWCGIELLSSHVDQMSRLQILHVHSDNSYSRDSSKSQESLENVVRLVKKMHVIHSPNQLKDIRWSSRHDVRMRCSLVIRELESLLPPLIQPLFFDYSKHWRSFWAHDLAEVDFSRVEDVELPSADQKPIDLHSVDQLQRFRNMKSLTYGHSGHSNVFRWGVDERRQHEASLCQTEIAEPTDQQQQLQQSLLITESKSMHTPSNLPRLVPLRRLRIENGTYDILNDAMYAFGPSLKEVRALFQRSETTQVEIASWNLPKLRSLELWCEGKDLGLYSGSLGQLPRLSQLFLSSAEFTTDLETTRTIVQQSALMQRWTCLTNLRKLCLVGVATATFDPSSLRWMPHLEHFHARGVRTYTNYVYTIRPTSIDLANLSTPPRHMPSLILDVILPNTHLWTWDWDMPSLLEVELYSDLALLFPFQWVKHCPRLEVLTLNIKHSYRLLKLSDFSVHDNDHAETSPDPLPGSESPPPPLSSTLKQLHLKGSHRTAWLFASDATLEALLQACGPQLTVLTLASRQDSILQHLIHLARQPAYRQLRRISITLLPKPQSGHTDELIQVGNTRLANYMLEERHRRFLVNSQTPPALRDGLLWFVVNKVYALWENVEKVESSLPQDLRDTLNYIRQ